MYLGWEQTPALLTTLRHWVLFTLPLHSISEMGLQRNIKNENSKLNKQKYVMDKKNGNQNQLPY